MEGYFESEGEKQNGKSIKQKVEGRRDGCRYAGRVFRSLPLTSLVQPFDRNFVLHWKTCAVCFHATNNSRESKKRDGSGGGAHSAVLLFFIYVVLHYEEVPLHYAADVYFTAITYTWYIHYLLLFLCSLRGRTLVSPL